MEHKPPSSADLETWRREDMARRAGKKVHQKGPSPIHGHVSLDEADKEAQRLARLKFRSIGNDPSKLPDVAEMRGRSPQRPDRSTK